MNKTKISVYWTFYKNSATFGVKDKMTAKGRN